VAEGAGTAGDGAGMTGDDVEVDGWVGNDCRLDVDNTDGVVGDLLAMQVGIAPPAVWRWQPSDIPNVAVSPSECDWLHEEVRRVCDGVCCDGTVGTESGAVEVGD
jgi:hypothetical protein